MRATHPDARRSGPSGQIQKSPEAMLPGFSILPVMPPVAVPAIIRPAVVGVRPRSVIVGRAVIIAVIAVARPIAITIIRPVGAGGDGACGQCAGSQAEAQSGTKPPPRLSRRGHDGCANSGNR